MAFRVLRRVSLWDKESESMMTGMRIAPGSAEYEDLSKRVTSQPEQEYCAIGLPMFTPSQPIPTVGMQCSHCKTSFAAREEQVEHYRLDWHQRNLQRSLLGKTPLTEEQFVNDSSDESSTCTEEENSDGDDDEDKGTLDEDDEEVDQVLGRQARMFFLNADGVVISMYRAILFSRKCQVSGEQDAVQRTQGITRKQFWAVMLLGGGHFAAAVFHGKEVVIHKTFHNYTVRAKQGGNQSARDGQSGTSHPKSSGASLRRYNEMSQRQHIQVLMESWKSHLARCKLIFYHAKHSNRSTLFGGGKKAILDSRDARLRTIPFPTKRAKFSEVKRIHELLSEVCVHGTEEEFRSMIKDSAEKENKPKNPTISKKIEKNEKSKAESSPSNKSKRKPKSQRRESLHFSSTTSESEEDSESEVVLMTSMMTISTKGLGGVLNECPISINSLGGTKEECSINIDKNRWQNKKKKSQNPPNRDSPNKKDNYQKDPMLDALYTACRTGDLEKLSTLVGNSVEHQSEENGAPRDVNAVAEEIVICKDLSQIHFGSQCKTLLHVAAENNKKDIVWWLMDNGCDPSVADRQGLLPFSASKSKEIHKHFRRFRAQYPEKFDYEKANIPSPLTPEREKEQAAHLAKRKKAKKQAQQEKRKQKEQEEKERKREQDEKTRFLNLSDREKRALAAERRLLQHCEEAETPSVVRQRCFSCPTDITGMVPFKYYDFKFCSTKCVKDHRSKNS